MKRSELAVGMTVETRMGAPMRVVDAGQWGKGTFYRLAGVTVDGVPVETDGRKQKGAHGVLVVSEGNLKNLMATKMVIGRVMQPAQLHPLGTYAAQRAAEDAASEAAWNAEIANDQGLLAQVTEHWGSKAQHLLQVSGVEPDEDGRLTKDERKTVITLILAGQNR